MAMLLVGVGQTVLGAGLVWYYPDGFSPGSGSRGIVTLIGIGTLMIAAPQLLGGIGILRGAEWGRRIAILCSVTFGLNAFFLVDLTRREGNLLLVVLFGLAFVLYAYSFIVLWLRWRRPATT